MENEVTKDKTIYDSTAAVRRELPTRDVFLLSGATNLIFGISLAAFGYYTLQYNAYRWITCGALLGMCTMLPAIKVVSDALRRAPHEADGMSHEKIKQAVSIYKVDEIKKNYEKGGLKAVAVEMRHSLFGMAVLIGGGLLLHKYGHLHAYISKGAQCMGAMLLGVSLCRAVSYPIFQKLAQKKKVP